MNLGPGKEFDRVRGMLERIAEISDNQKAMSAQLMHRGPDDSGYFAVGPVA